MERGTWSKIRLCEYFGESAPLPAPSLRKAGPCFLPLASLDSSVPAPLSYRPSDPLGLPGLRWRGSVGIYFNIPPSLVHLRLWHHLLLSIAWT